jgi:hypothetical protein
MRPGVLLCAQKKRGRAGFFWGGWVMGRRSDLIRSIRGRCAGRLWNPGSRRCVVPHGRVGRVLSGLLDAGVLARGAAEPLAERWRDAETINALRRSCGGAGKAPAAPRAARKAPARAQPSRRKAPGRAARAGRKAPAAPRAPSRTPSMKRLNEANRGLAEKMRQLDAALQNARNGPVPVSQATRNAVRRMGQVNIAVQRPVVPRVKAPPARNVPTNVPRRPRTGVAEARRLAQAERDRAELEDRLLAAAFNAPPSRPAAPRRAPSFELQLPRNAPAVAALPNLNSINRPPSPRRPRRAPSFELQLPRNAPTVAALPNLNSINRPAPRRSQRLANAARAKAAANAGANKMPPRLRQRATNATARVNAARAKAAAKAVAPPRRSQRLANIAAKSNAAARARANAAARIQAAARSDAAARAKAGASARARANAAARTRADAARARAEAASRASARLAAARARANAAARANAEARARAGAAVSARVDAARARARAMTSR